MVTLFKWFQNPKFYWIFFFNQKTFSFVKIESMLCSQTDGYALGKLHNLCPGTVMLTFTSQEIFLFLFEPPYQKL